MFAFENEDNHTKFTQTHRDTESMKCDFTETLFVHIIEKLLEMRRIYIQRGRTLYTFALSTSVSGAYKT